MLIYDVKLDENNIQRDELVWSEKYLAPDLSFVSGVTDQRYHIDKKDFIPFSIGNDTNAGALHMTCENVTRNGYIKIKEKEYPVLSGKTIDYSTDNEHEYHYVDLNGVIYYISGGTTVTINNWLKEEWSENGVSIVEGDVEASIEGNSIYLDTILWIEDETVTIDGNKYYFDRYDVSAVGLSPGGIKYYEDGECLAPSAITKTKSNEIYYNHFENTSEYLYVTKFKLFKKEQKSIQFDKLSFCTYFYYVKYKDNYCPVSLSGESYVCEVLTRLYTKDITEEDDRYYETSVFEVLDDETGSPLKVSNIDRISLLKNHECHITVEETDLKVEHLLQNSNHGDELAIYLTDGTTNVSVGEIITLENDSYEKYVSGMYEMSGETFVLYNNKKYRVIERLCDKVKINNHEYPIEYINGIVDEKDALVNIMGEKVPMMITGGGNKLQRHGETVSATSNSATVVTYDIVKHNGITINDRNYQVISGSVESGTFVEIEERIPFEFVITNIEGSSLLICTPNFSVYEFDDEFRTRVNSNICDYFVTNQTTTTLYVKNRAFGQRAITSDIGFASGEEKPKSSNDYYNLFDNLKLYADTAHIHIPVKLDINVATNIMQDDIVERDFYKVEKDKAINKIVDMEKDVYTPKYMSGTTSYNGSGTTFFPVSEIEVNLHFRTRNLDNWKVNDGYNNIEASGNSDNWFVTDFYPYNEIISSSTKNAEILQNSSDLMGLLYFTNDDVYYQRDKIGKSFLRFSYYDSTDPQTQSLLATSCVFLNEHKLYKTFIDNSRKNIYNYGLVEVQPTGRINDNGVWEEGELQRNVSNKISVMTEFIGKFNKKKHDYRSTEIDTDVLSEDSRRISSKLLINNKYETDTSSEGFYIYMFKEYSENLHPKPIYMKVEFNHAGVGRTIPFIIPMHWSSATTESYKNDKVNIYNPERRLRFCSGATDINEMQSGYTLSYVYAQTYIPLYAVYDFKEKEYAYVFDERYVTPPASGDGRVVLNLFELKIADESSMTPTDKERENLTMGRPKRAVININKNQFNKIHFR